MWRDVSLANRDALQTEIAAFRSQLDRIAAALRTGDAAALEAMFARAAAARRAWGAEHPAPAVPADAARAR
jgi:prephenate dehydrogenase